MAYTIKQIDDAIAAVTGRPVRQWPGWSRTTEVERAGALSFFQRRPEDENSAVLREARKDLDEKGFYSPSDNSWPDE